MSGPLAGIKVLDLTQIYQGPYAAFLMAQAGAEVVKVEPRGGERLRGAGGAKTQLSFATLNSNKKSITLDLKHAEGKAILRRLTKQVDVLLENYAPGVMDRLELGWDALHEINPSLIYVSGTGYGLSGPNRDLLAMDHTIQAASGVMSVTGDADQPPGRAGGAPSDIMGGVHMYSGALTALLGRATTGKGTRVEVAMQETMYFTLSSELAVYHATGKIPPRSSSRSPAGPVPYSRYQCSDGGYIAIICVAETHWQRILQVIERTDLADDPEFVELRHRRKHEDEVNAMISEWCQGRTRDDAYEGMRQAGVPVAPIRDLEEVRTDPHMHERGALRNMTHPSMGDIVLPASPLRFSEYDGVELEFFPEPGAHNEEVLQGWLGMSAAQMNALRDDRVI